MAKTYVKGTVNGKRFNNGREMIEMIYRSYYSNENIRTFNEFASAVNGYDIYPINDSNERSFLKSETEYNKLTPEKQKKFYDSKPFVLNGKNYYLKTETGEPETSEHIRFARDHGISVVLDDSYMTDIVVPSPTCSPIEKLKNNFDKLISFYIAETKSVLTKQQYDDIAKVIIVIDETNEPYYEVVGRYDLREIIKELERLLEKNSDSVSNFRRILDELLSILWELLELESCYKNNENGEPFFIPFSELDLMDRIKEIESKLNEIIEEIRRMLNEVYWPKETIKLIEKILDNIYPKIVGRKRLSTVLGKFTASKNQITLYKSAIENWLPDVDCFDKMLDVYSHELFHAFHYVLMNNPTKWEYDDNSRIVKESLARYIEYRYGLLNICKTAISSDLIRMWNDYDMYDFPYAGAKYVDKYVGLCEQMFKESINKGTKKAFHLIDSAHAL